MVIFLITSLFVLAFLTVAVYFWQKPADSLPSESLPPAPGRALFIDGVPEDAAGAEESARSEQLIAAATMRDELLERARSGEKEALVEARKVDAKLYQQVLDTLSGSADSAAALLSLVSYLSRHELPVTPMIAERFISTCKDTPSLNVTAKMLHVAALSDDAAVYQNAVERSLEFWRGGNLGQVAPQELRAMLEGEFWILTAPTRSSGAGFILKRTLRNAQRELDAAHNQKHNPN